MSNTPCWIYNNGQSSAAATGVWADNQDRSPHENSVVSDTLVESLIGAIVRFGNPCSGLVRWLAPKLYTTDNDEYNGNIVWSENITFAGGFSFGDVAAAAKLPSDPLTTSPAIGSKIFLYTGYRNNASAQCIRTRWASGNALPNGAKKAEAFESAADAVSLTGRNATPDQVPALGVNDVVWVGTAEIIYKTATGDEEDVFVGWGDSNMQGDGDSKFHLGHLVHLAFKLLRPIIVFATSGSHIGGTTTARAADLANFQFVELMGTLGMPFIQINALRGATDGAVDGPAALDAVLDFWEDVAADNPQMSLHGWTYPVETMASLIANSAEDPEEAQIARLAYNQAWRDLTSGGATRYLGYSDAAHAIDDPDDENEVRTDLGDPDLIQNGVHFGAEGMMAICAAFNPDATTNLTARVPPMLFGPFVAQNGVNDVAFVECNVLCNPAFQPELTKGFQGLSINFSGGLATFYGGWSVEPEDGRRMVHRCRMYPDRAIEEGETFDLTDITVDPACTLVGADDRVAEFGVFSNSATAYDNNSTVNVPTDGDVSTALADRDGSSATQDDDFDDYMPFSGPPTIVGGKFLLANEFQNGYVPAYIFENDEGGGHGRPEVIIESLDWYLGDHANGQLQVLFGPAVFDGKFLAFLIEDSGGPRFFIKNGGGFNCFSSAVISGFNAANKHRMTIRTLGSTAGKRDRFLITIYDVTAAAQRYSATVELADATGSGDRPDTNAPYIVALRNINGGGSDPCEFTRFAINKLTADVTAPAFPADHPAAGAAYIDPSGQNVVVPMTDDSQPLLPDPADDEIAGFSGTGVTVGRAIVVSGKAVLLELADADRFLAADADGQAFAYAFSGGAADKLRDSLNNYATADSFTARNDSIWDGETEGPPEEPEPEPEDPDPAPAPPLAYGVPASNLPVNLRRIPTLRRRARSN